MAVMDVMLLSPFELEVPDVSLIMGVHTTFHTPYTLLSLTPSQLSYSLLYNL